MPNLIIQPASNKNARQHYVDTVLNPVPINKVRNFVNPAIISQLREFYKGESIPCWGFTPGQNDSNLAKWNRIDEGDVALFLKEKVAFASAVVTLKIHNPALAAELWGYDANNSTWEYMYFLAEVQNRNISYNQLNSLLKYEPTNNFQQALVLDEKKSNDVFTVLGLASDTFQPAPTAEDYYRAIEPASDLELDKKVVSNARTEQAYLRKVLFGRRTHEECGICHTIYPIEFLVAAHIKKRSLCSDSEKRDYQYITMPMCKFGCDELYEKGYIGIKNKAVSIVEDANLSPAVNKYLKSVEGNACTFVNDNTLQYFEWHNSQMRVGS